MTVVKIIANSGDKKNESDSTAKYFLLSVKYFK